MASSWIYWIIVLIWIILSVVPLFGYGSANVSHASEGVLLLLFIILGWNVFGAPVRRG